MAEVIRTVDDGDIRTVDDGAIRIVSQTREFTCPDKIDCPPDTILTNYSSESLDLNEFWSVVYGAMGCIGRCTSAISQQDADLCAQRQMALCVIDEEDDDDGGGEEPPEPPVVFSNEEQECTVQCPNGTSFTYVVPAGTFIADTQAQADAQAASYACQQAPLNLLCLGPLQRCTCANEAFLETVTATGAERNLTFDVISGSLPAGVDLIGLDMSFQLTGVPSVAGLYTFGIRATDDNGNHADAVYLLSVLEIADSALPDFQLGVAYSHQLTATGGSGNYAWRILSGTLPTGLTMSLTGLISGTPTAGASGTLVFDVVDTDCEAADRTFFPPRVSMATISTVRIATILGYPEFPGFISSPPKKYKKLTWSGTSEMTATWLGTLAGVDYAGVNCARAKYEYVGTGEINNAGAQVSRYVKNFFQACPEETQWPRNISIIPNFGFLALKGYCWPQDPNSCTVCEDPPQFSRDVAANSIMDWSDFIGGRNFTALGSTDAQNHTTAGGTLIIEGGTNMPITAINDVLAAWVRAAGVHNIDAALADEYTDAIALANAYTFVSNGTIAETTPRTTGFVNRFVAVSYVLTATNLVIGEEYTVNVRIYNTVTGAFIIQSYTFVAADTSHVITDSVPTPAAGVPLQVRSPVIGFTP